MPIFEEEKIMDLPVEGQKEVTPALGSPASTPYPSPPKLPSYAPPLMGIAENDKSRMGLSNDQLSAIARMPSKDTGPNLIPLSEVVANKRYNTYTRGMDLENIYGLQQSWYSQLGNSAVKLAGIATGTFLQSFASIPNAIHAIAVNGSASERMSRLSGQDGYESDIDNWLKNLEDRFPNYYTRRERESPFLAMIPFMPGSANFWGNDFLKNLGFMAGAIGGALVQDAIVGSVTGGVGAAPLVAGQIGKASLFLNKIFAGTNKLDAALDLAKGADVAGKTILSMKGLGQAAEGIRTLNGLRYGLALYGSSRTEAAVEARDSYRVLKEELTKDYIRTHGEEPPPSEIAKIEEYATAGMNTRFGVNMALLTLSNSIQFGNLFKSFTTASKGVSGALTTSVDDIGKIALKEGTLDVFEKVVPPTKLGRIWESVRPKLENILAEGVYEEGGQFAVEKGVYDYYTRKYKKPSEDWDAVNEVMNSTVKGLGEQFGTQEGLESMIVGGLIAGITTPVVSRIQKKMGVPTDEEKLQSTLNVMNQYGLTGIISDLHSNVLDSVGIAKDMDEAVKSGNIFRYKNLKHDMFFNYVTSRIPIGMHDVTIEQLKMLKNLDKEEFEKTFGTDFNASNKKTVNEYVDNLILKANEIKSVTDSLDATYINPYKQTLNPATNEETQETLKHHLFNNWKKDLAYYASLVPEMRSREMDVRQTLANMDARISPDILKNVTDATSLKQLAEDYESKAVQLGKTITDATPISVARSTREEMRALRTLSEKINLAINNKDYDEKLFNEVFNFELNNQDVKADRVVGPEKNAELFKYGVDLNKIDQLKKRAASMFDDLSTEKGFDKYFQQAEQMQQEQQAPPPTPVSVFEYENKAGAKEPVELNREYQIPPFKKATIKKLADDRYQVTTPDGNKTFYSSKEDAAAAADEFNQQFKGLEKVKILALNPDGTVKIEDANGDIYNISLDKLKGYEKLKTAQEELEKVSGEVEAEQKSAEIDSSTVASEEVDFSKLTSGSKYIGNPEDLRKFWEWLFWSTTSASEDRGEDWKTAHNMRAITFFNNARKFKNANRLRAMIVNPLQEEALGLSGLTKLSMREEPKRGADGKIVIENTDNALIAAVYVEQDETGVYYFVDQNGNRISRVGQPVDLNQIVFSTMPDTSLYWDAGGKGTERYRIQDKEKAEEMSQRWKLKRKQLFEVAPDNPEIYAFRISNGIPVVDNIRDRHHAGDVIIDENKIGSEEGLLVVSTKGKIPHAGQEYTVPVGVTMFQYQDIFQPAINNIFNKDQAEAIFQVMKLLAADIKRQADNKEKIVFNPLYTNFLRNTLYWKETNEIKKNQMYIDKKMNLFFAGKKYDLTRLEDAKASIMEDLQKAYHNINNKYLSSKEEAGSNKFYEPFTEFYIENGQLKKREWYNYQSYLLASKYPDGKNRSEKDTPVTTYIAKPTPERPSFKQKYAILEPTEFPALPISATPKEEKPAPVPTEKNTVNIGGKDYVIGEAYTSNKVFKSGNPVQFTIEVTDGEPSVVVDIEKQKSTTLKDAIADDNLMNVVTGILINTYKIPKEQVDAMSLADRVTRYASQRIVYEILPPQQEAPTQEAPKPPAPVSDIEAKKADIEIRRQEAINQATTQNSHWSTPLITTNKYVSEFNKTPTRITWWSKQDMIDDINSGKYDAELVALEGKPTEAAPAEAPPVVKEEPPTAKPTPKKGGRRRDYNGFRLVGMREEKKEKITDVDLQLFKQWHSENVPKLPYEILENIITVSPTIRAYGVFEDGVAKFYKGAIRGTEYHEIFEGIWKAFLSTEEREAILNELRAKSGTFTDRASGRKIRWDEATDNELKERIADDFAEYRLGKLPARSLLERIVKFFKNIIEYVKSFVMKPSMKESLFRDIDKGRFRDVSVPESVKNAAPEYSLVEFLTETNARDYIEDIAAISNQYVFGNNRSLFEIGKITNVELYNYVKDKYINDLMIDDTDPDKLTTSQFDELFVKALEYMRTFGTKFATEGFNDVNSEDTNNRDYAPEPFTVDWKKQSPQHIKMLVGTLIRTKPSNKSSLTADVEVEPDWDASSIGGYRLVNFGRTFATLLDKLSNTNNVGTFIRKMFRLANSNTDYRALINRLKMGGNSVTVDFSKFEKHDWRLFVQFYQTFTKQKPNAYIQYVINGKVQTKAANTFTAAKEVQDDWQMNMKTLSKLPDSLITYNGAKKTYQVKKGVKDIPTGTAEERIAFLDKLGIDFPIAAYNKLKTEKDIEEKSQRERFIDAVSSIKKYIESNEDVYSLTGKSLSIDTYIKRLSDLYVAAENPPHETTRFNLNGDRVNEYTESNVASVFEDEVNESDTVDDLIAKRPELNDVFSKNSLFLKKGGLFYNPDGTLRRRVKISYIEGIDKVSDDKSANITRVGFGERNITQMNQNLNGIYYILIPADASIEWEMNIGNYILYSQVQSGEAWDRVYTVFDGYLEDEINLAISDRSYLKNTKAKAKELRFFREILPADMVGEIEAYLKDDDSAGAFKYVKDNKDKIHEAVKEAIMETVEDTRKDLITTQQLTGEESTNYTMEMLDEDFASSADVNKKNLTQKEVDDILTFANINYYINNIEYHKVIFGDPYQFKTEKGKLDETKRIKSFLSPRRKTFDTPEFNTHLNNERNKAGELSLEAKNDVNKFGDPGHHVFKPYMNTTTLDDVNIIGSLSKLISSFDNTTETDGFSIMLDVVYREMKLKNGQWVDETAEPWHQWQMAYTRNRLSKKGEYVYTNSKLKQQDEEMLSKPEPKHMIEVAKSIVTGNKANRNYIDNVLDKFSQMPLYYSMVEGTNLEKLYIKMWKEKRDYLVYESGRKVGTEGLFSIYTKKGEFNDELFNNLVQVPWKAHGIQVETAYDKFKEDVTRGSQPTKISSMDLFENGKPITEDAGKEYARYNKILNEFHRIGYENFLEKIGLRDTGDDFEIVDKVALSKMLENEILRRELSENVKDTIRTKDGQFIIPFESSNSFIQIRDIIFSFLNKSINAPKMPGGSYVQVPVTGFEKIGEGRTLILKTALGGGKFDYEKITKDKYNTLSDEQKKNVRLGDDTLKMPTRDDPYMEIMLPHWFRGKLPKKYKTDEQLLNYLNNTEEGRELLRGVGYRIPTQALSSMAAIRVKRFLPQYAGYMVVVPSEITTMAGSDFDIDKMYIYLKSFYIDENNNIRIARWQDDEASTKEFFSNIYDNTIQKQLNKLIEYEQFRHKLVTFLENAELSDQKFDITVIEAMSDDDVDFYNKHSELIAEVVSQAEEEDMLPSEYIKEQIRRLGNKASKLTKELFDSQLKDTYVRKMVKRAIENEYYDSLEKLITIPENYERLISPVDDAGLKKTASDLAKITGESKQENTTRNRLLSRSYMTKLRHAFITGKKWVGIAAVNITNHSMAQKIKLHIDPEKFKYLSEADAFFLGDGSVALPHNTLTKGNKTYVSLSGRTTDKNKDIFISSRLSGYATSFVDIAKDPYIMQIIKSDIIVGVFMFLERIGAGDYTAFFMNQPIIREYLTQLDNINGRTLFNKENIKMALAKFPATEDDVSGTQLDVSLNALKKNIEDYYSSENRRMSADFNAMQNKMFIEFLKYAKMGEFLFKFTQATNYDTTKFRSGDLFFKKQTRTRLASALNIFSSIDDLLDNTHLGAQAYYLDRGMSAIGKYIQTEKREIRENIVNPILEEYAANDYMKEDDYSAIGLRIATSFIDYLVQTRSAISGKLHQVMVDNETAAYSLLEKAKLAHPNDDLIQSLVPRSSREQGAVTIKLKGNEKDSGRDENYWIGRMRELRDNPDTNALYRSLVKLSLFQGTLQSAYSIKNIIPLEDYANEIGDVMRNITYHPSMDIFVKGMFHRNQWKNPNVFRKVYPNYYEPKVPVYELVDGEPKFYYETSAFPNVETVSVVHGSNRVLTLIEKYNYVATQSNYVIVDRFTRKPAKVGKQQSPYIDIKTGLEYSEQEYKRLLAKGDPIAKEVYGYKKVMNDDGTPFSYFDAKGNKTFVYKLINLLGDGNIVPEYYNEFKPSVLENGTVKEPIELNDKALREHFAPSPDKVAYENPKMLIEETPPFDVSPTPTATAPISGVEVEIPPFAEPTTPPALEIGRYVKYKEGTYIVTKINDNGTYQIYNPTLEGASAKISVSAKNLSPLKDKAVIIEYNKGEYIVTPKDTIISLATNKIMKWGEENGDRKAILQKAGRKEKVETLPFTPSELPIIDAGSTKITISTIDLSDKIKSLPNSVYNDRNNVGLFLDVIINTTKDYKKGADINQKGFVVNFSGVDSKDDIKLTINNVSKEGENYRVVGKGGQGARAALYNFLVSSDGNIVSITSAEGKTFTGETYANIYPTEELRKSIQSTSNKELMMRLASLEENFDTTTEFTEEQKNTILSNFAAKHKMTIEDARQYINDGFVKQAKEKVISKLKECYL